MARPAATVYFVLMLTSVRATELTADWPTMEVGALKEATAASRPSMEAEIRFLSKLNYVLRRGDNTRTLMYSAQRV